jgi:preprotein translocase subunit SecG
MLSFVVRFLIFVCFFFIIIIIFVCFIMMPQEFDQWGKTKLEGRETAKQGAP